MYSKLLLRINVKSMPKARDEITRRREYTYLKRRMMQFRNFRLHAKRFPVLYDCDKKKSFLSDKQ